MTDVPALLTRYNGLKARRDGYWLGVWREVRKYVYPNYSDCLSEGGERSAAIFDTTAIDARSRLAAGIYNWMAPPDKRWYDLKSEYDELAEDEEVKDYFSHTTRNSFYLMANSNWPSVLRQALDNLACGIDAVIFMGDAGRDKVVHFRSIPIETVVYAENNEGTVDTVMREIEWTARQVLQEFPDRPLPEKIAKAAADPKRKDDKFKILHAVFPRKDRDPRLIDRENMPFADYYIDLDSKTVIEEGGFQEFPYAVCSFEKSDNESYGRGPGINKLPTIRMLNRMQEAYLLLTERMADPNWLIPDGSLVNKNFDRAPGAVNFYRPGAGGARPEAIQGVGNIHQLAEKIREDREEVKLGFFWDTFDPLGDLKDITATEAEIRNEGKMIPFAPIAGNLHSTFFPVVIHRVLGLAARYGKLPEPPEKILAHPEYKVEFVSKIALAIKRLESLGYLQTEASLANLIANRPDVLDNLEEDKVFRDIGLVNGMSPTWLRPVKERDAIRQARARDQQQIQEAAMLAEAAKAAPSLGKSPEPGSPLDSLMAGGGNA